MEKRKLERLFGMGSRYVLEFSNRTFEEFVLDTTGRGIYDEKYDYGSGSKANRLRAFWNEEANPLVAKLIGELIDCGQSEGLLRDSSLVDDCQKIVSRLSETSTVSELDALTVTADEPNFEIVAKAVREAIEKNEPEAGLDRLHTFVTMFVRRYVSRGASPSTVTSHCTVCSESMSSISGGAITSSPG